MSAPATMPDLLERLLTDAPLRAELIAGRLALPPAFATVDPIQLARTADQLARDLLHRQFRGSGGMLSLYPSTLAAAGGAAELDRVFMRFVASPAYRRYREWPREPTGQCLEEAFYRFAEAIDLGDPVAREREFLGAMVRAVLLSPDPAFTLPPELVRRPGGALVAIARRGPTPHLFAATGRGLVQGALTPFLADLLGDDPPPAVAARHGVASPVLDAALGTLRALGLA